MRQDDLSTPPARYRISAESAPPLEGLRELLDSRELFGLLLGRELQIRYKQTALGVLWVVLQPLVPAIIFSVVFGTFARLPSAGVPYLPFALSGLLVFGLFSGFVSRAGGSFLRDTQLVTKVYFPRAILPLASGSAAIVDFLVGLVVLLAVMAFIGQIPAATVIVIPLITVLTLCLALGFGLAVSALSAHYRDFGYAVPFVAQLLLYTSPVVYSGELVPPSAKLLYSLNPLVPLIEGFRWALLGTPPPDAGQITAGSITGLLILALGIIVFARVSRDLTDVI